jgi:hypothetical protein
MRRLIYLQGQREDPQVDHITFPTGEQHIHSDWPSTSVVTLV